MRLVPLSWKFDRTPVVAVAERTNDRGFDLVLSVATSVTERVRVAAFVADSLLRNGIRHWEDDNTLNHLNASAPFRTFVVGGGEVYHEQLAKRLSITRTKGGIRVTVPCHWI